MNKFIGIPYSKMDCYQLVREASREIYGKELPEISDYIHQPAETIEQYQASNKWREIPSPEVGCVVVLGQTPTFAKHIGLWLGDGVLHATRKYGSVVQDEFQLISAGYSNFRYYQWEG